MWHPQYCGLHTVSQSTRAIPFGYVCGVGLSVGRHMHGPNKLGGAFIDARVDMPMRKNSNGERTQLTLDCSRGQ
jgi:hypothetical protein